MKNELMERLAAENPDLLGENGAVYGWIKDGWGLDDDPMPEQIAASLLMEAITADHDVIHGMADASYPQRLRTIASQILKERHFKILD